MDNKLYEYSPITARPKLTWPNGARVAFYVGVNIEHFEVDKPSTSIFGGTAMLVPDPLNYGWRDYAVRVGIWRMIEALDKYKMRASVLLNSDVLRALPSDHRSGQAAQLGLVRPRQEQFQLPNRHERRRRKKNTSRHGVDGVQGYRPSSQGLAGPALTETFETPRLLKELGLTYVLDWCADDQPFALTVPGMMSVPYSIEVNDISLFVGKSLSGEAFYQIVVDQFDQLYKDGEKTGRVMSLCLHPFIINQPFRHKYLEKALRIHRQT